MLAVTYLRSSKDRADASPAAQRHALEQLAAGRGMRIVGEYVDAVVSGADDDRPEFQRLLADIRNPRRGWAAILVLDTSRIARRRHIAVIFEHECAKAGVQVVYRSVPDDDPVTAMLLRSILQAMDEWHSLTSRSKGLAGMATNVRAGYRAGGRAPFGYVLEHIDTGAVRDGRPVRKSRLRPGPQFDAVRRYLNDRASGVPRAKAAASAGIQLNKASLVALEWNALTYAGATTWNVHREQGTGSRRRPRDEWQVQHGTHEPAITIEQAEAIIAKLEAYDRAGGRRRASGYALAGLLVTPDGTRWHGDRGAYRVTGRQVQAADVDKVVIQRVLADLENPLFVRTIAAGTRAALATKTERKDSTAALAKIERDVERLTGMLADTSEPGPILRRLEALEQDRRRLADQAARDAAEAEAARQAASMSEHDIRRALVAAARDLHTVPPDQWRDALSPLIERVVLDPATLEARVEYRFSMASPRGCNPRPVLRASVTVPVRTAVLRASAARGR